MEEINFEEAKAAIYSALKSAFQVSRIAENELDEIIDISLKTDMDYIQRINQSTEMEYDEDEVFKLISRAVNKRLQKHKIDVDEFVDAYLESMEIYLESVGAIEWV